MENLHRESDESLLLEASRGNEKAFGELVSRYGTRVLSLCRKYLGDSAEAEEAAQEVFLRVWRKASSFGGRALFSTWLYRVTVNIALNHCRRQNRLVDSLDRPVGDDDSEKLVNRLRAPESGRPDRSYERRETALMIRKVVASLPEKQKTAVILCLMEQFSYREAARIMKTTVASVESLVFRGKKNLRRALASTGDGKKSSPGEKFTG